MKRIFLLTILAALFLGVSQSYAVAPLNKKANYTIEEPVKKSEKLSEAEVQKMVARINEIKSKDLKSLPASERRELRKEVREIRDKLNKNADGFSVYIGGGVILIVIVVLLLLLL